MLRWTPVWETSRADWLPRLFWKEILSTLRREIIMKTLRAFLKKKITSKKVVSYPFMIKYRHITCFPFAMFKWTPVWQTSPANWLPRFIWKELLYILCRESIVKKWPTVFRNMILKIVMACLHLTRFRHITCFPLAMYRWTPFGQPSAADYVPILVWKEVLSTLCRESIKKNDEPFLRNMTSK